MPNVTKTLLKLIRSSVIGGLISVIVLPTVVQANSLARYECDVVDFVYSTEKQPKKSFIQRNMEKKFSIITTNKNLYLSMIEKGEVFPPEEYFFPNQSALVDLIAMQPILAGLNVVAIDLTPIKGTTSDFKAKKTYTVGLVANVWDLTCTKS